MNHPLSPGTNITANIKQCSCVGGGTITINTTIIKIINSPSGIWYYCSSGNTINSNWITSVN